MTYRDPLEGARERVSAREGEVAAAEGRVGREFLRRLLPADRAALAALRAEAEAPRPPDLAGLEARESALTRYRDALVGLALGAPELETWLDGLPEQLPDVTLSEDPFARTVEMTMTPGSLERRMEHAREGLAAFFAARGIEAPLQTIGFRALQARFVVDGTPVALLIELGYDAQRVPEVRFTLRTTVRRALPKLTLAPETWGHAFPKMLGLLRDRAVGHEAFDTLFLVDTEEPADTLVLEEAVRDALLRLAHFDVPRLEVDGGLATLRFWYASEPPALGAAVGVLAALRALRPRLVLLE
jgi:hypothetical protein